MTSEESDPLESPRKLIGVVRFVLFDFDGPICGLFAGHSAKRVAREQISWLRGQGLGALVPARGAAEGDPHAVLRELDLRHRGSDLVTVLEEQLTQAEVRAASSARPTPYADVLIRTWSAVGAGLAVATNNSPQAVTRYLEGRGLLSCFAPHIYGRTRNLHLLKPDPHCVHRALAALGADPAESLMIGDSPADYLAARAAGTHFLGYARDARKELLLREAGAQHVVTSLLPVLDLLRSERR
ncbi:HAD family hydrolase [Streptomyces sp. G45]|uniref:HAD family hydrolase n=1 Tax=Streptomyces sp. G45 TaxID=3406627 RepID=UPI003C2903DA